MFAPS
jgi:hypothetical protein